VVFGLVGLFTSPFLVVIAVIVWLAAKAEHTMSTIHIALSGLSVRDGMITDFKTVSPTDPLSRAVSLTLTGFQQDFPVTDGAALVGVLTHSDVLKGLAEQGGTLSVKQAMHTGLEAASPSEALGGALTRMRQAGDRVSVVVEDQKVVGLLTVANIGELLAVEAARQPGAAAAYAATERS
jgi:CBS domain-containing protein